MLCQRSVERLETRRPDFLGRGYARSVPPGEAIGCLPSALDAVDEYDFLVGEEPPEAGARG
ncbi:hypothetical protein ACFQ0G_51665 [Streptomyces chiangmaiensis]